MSASLRVVEKNDEIWRSNLEVVQGALLVDLPPAAGCSDPDLSLGCLSKWIDHVLPSQPEGGTSVSASSMVCNPGNVQAL